MRVLVWNALKNSRQQCRRIHSLPWPRVSDLANLRLNTLHTDFSDLANKYGPVFVLPVAEARAVVVGDAEFAEFILSPRRAGRAFAYRWEDPLHMPFAKWGELLDASDKSSETAGIFFGNGPHHWAPARRACERGLLMGRSVLENGEVVAAQVADSLAQKWENAGAGSCDVSVDIREATLAVITQVAFGGEEPLDSEASLELRSIYNDMIACLEELVGVPSNWWWILRRGRTQQLKIASNRLKKLLVPRIRSHQRQAEGLQRKCIMDILLNTGMSEGAVVYNCIQILGAGHDTVATTLAILLWELAKDQKTQEAVRREVSTSAKNHPLLSACVKEVLRLWPAAPLTVRQALEPVPEFDGIQLPVGTIAIVAPWLLGRSTAYWDDPQFFKPERFLSGEKSTNFSWLPFGYGMRNCVGQQLAIAELEAFTAALLRRIRFLPQSEPEIEWFLTLRLRKGLKLRMEPIQER